RPRACRSRNRARRALRLGRLAPPIRWGNRVATIDSRREQMFPTLSPEQMVTARRFASGEPQRFGPGESLFDVGEREIPAWLVLEGSLVTTRRSGLGAELPIVIHKPGQLSGEISQPSGRGVLAAGKAGKAGLTALPFDAPHLRALIIGAADLGETIMRAFI